jgi:hypothetical protein
MQGSLAVVATRRDGIDEPAGEDRHEHVGERRDHHGHDDQHHVARFLAPMAERES